MKTETEMVMKIDRYYIKSRGIKMDESEARTIGIKRVYNWTSHIDYMHEDEVPVWTKGLYDEGAGEAILIESALRYVEGNPLYVSTCIVFLTVEMCNVFYIKNQKSYKKTDGFSHLLN
jgi:hypothetical protein